MKFVYYQIVPIKICSLLIDTDFEICHFASPQRLRWCRGSVLASDTQVRGFKPEAVGFLKGDKKSSARLPSVPCRRFAACNRTLGAFGHHFSPIVPPLSARGLPRVVDARGTLRPEKERLEDGDYNKPCWLQYFQGAKRAELEPQSKLLFASPHHLKQILRHYSPAGTHLAIPVTPFCY